MGEILDEMYVIGRIKYFRSWLLELKEKYFTKADVVDNSNASKPFKLKQIFNDDAGFDEATMALKAATPPVINDKNEFLLGERKKGAIVAWIDILKLRGKIKSVNRETLIILLNNHFAGLNLGSEGRSFDNTTTTSYKQYYKKLLQLIA
jgi:hypothetical protein